MAIPLKNSILEEIKQHGSLTDVELSKALIKNGFIIAEDRFNKLMPGLEIVCLIKVWWINKDKRRIEIVEAKEEDEVCAKNKAMMEKDYEAGFPGVENN